jgi:phosphoribosylaminoimidazolecarboxamide formyltransferase/IMP cyclohydrolase
MELRYGMNPHQRPATMVPVDAARPPFSLVNGQPSYINILDALGGWQLVQEASAALGRPAAASFKHVSPAGAAVTGPIDDVMAQTYGLAADQVGPVTSAYVRARDADPKSSYGDFVALSDPVDAELADLLRRVVCDGVIAPGFEPGVVATLAQKKQGAFLILEADAEFRPPADEIREIYGMRLSQPRDTAVIDRDSLGSLPSHAIDDVLLGLTVARHTQSNSVAYCRDGMTLGVGAGQQSRVDCTRLAGAKVDTWHLRRHPKIRAASPSGAGKVQDRVDRQVVSVNAGILGADERAEWVGQLDEVSFVSDGAIPFSDNIPHAHAHGVRYIAEPGGSIRSDEVRAACRRLGIVHVQTGTRLFRH